MILAAGPASERSRYAAESIRGIMASIRVDSCCVVNGGGGAWAFASLAEQLGNALWIDVSERPRRYNYLLVMNEFEASALGESFIPYRSMELAADKLKLAARRQSWHG